MRRVTIQGVCPSQGVAIDRLSMKFSAGRKGKCNQFSAHCLQSAVMGGGMFVIKYV